jgi:hypothetical protein
MSGKGTSSGCVGKLLVLCVLARSGVQGLLETGGCSLFNNKCPSFFVVCIRFPPYALLSKHVDVKS